MSKITFFLIFFWSINSFSQVSSESYTYIFDISKIKKCEASHTSEKTIDSICFIQFIDKDKSPIPFINYTVLNKKNEIIINGISDINGNSFFKLEKEYSLLTIDHPQYCKYNFKLKNRRKFTVSLSAKNTLIYEITTPKPLNNRQKKKLNQLLIKNQIENCKFCKDYKINIQI